MISLIVNGRRQRLDADPEMPLLWALRDLLGLKGTKYGCGIAQCGVCTVHVNGEAVRSCITPLDAVRGARVTTIEGLHPTAEHPLQKAWLDQQVPQCGYCQPGQIMQAAALLKETPKPTDAQIDAAMAGNLCRCGTYTRIKAAIRQAAGVSA
jgi:isoquinoline 1-oxidoreductase alpha subunit